MTDLIAARLVFLLHLAFLGFVVFGGILVARRARWAWLHVPALAWGIWIVMSHGLCPLTGIENALLERAGVGGYDGGFIDHYLVPLLYPPGLQPIHQTLLGSALVVFNALLYALAWRRRQQ